MASAFFSPTPFSIEARVVASAVLILIFPVSLDTWLVGSGPAKLGLTKAAEIESMATNNNIDFFIDCSLRNYDN